MKTPVGLRPAAWEPRQRLIGLAVVLALVASAALWWVLGAEGRRVGSACELYEGQQEPLRGLLVQVDDAAASAADEGDTHILPYFDNADSTLNTMRRWQSTAPRVADALGEVGDAGADGVEGADGEASVTFALLTDAVAEQQRLVEADVATDAAAHTAEVSAALDDADALCG